MPTGSKTITTFTALCLGCALQSWELQVHVSMGLQVMALLQRATLLSRLALNIFLSPRARKKLWVHEL